MTTPGHKQLTNFNDVKLFEQICSFIHPKDACADISPKNLKADYIAEKFDININQIDTQDFNIFYYLGVRYDTLFCFELLEHLTDPKNFFRNTILRALDENGILYLSTPARPKILWDKWHYNEISPKRLNKWILQPLGLKITRKQRLRPTHPWWFYVSGFRPLLRLFLNYTWIYEISLKS